MKEDKDIQIGTCNVRIHKGLLAAGEIADVLNWGKADTAAIPEVRWDDPDIKKMKNGDIYYGDCQTTGTTIIGRELVIGSGLRDKFISQPSVNERIMTIPIRVKFAKTSLICKDCFC